MDHGSIILDGTPGEVFAHRAQLEQAGLSVPQVTRVMDDLAQEGWPVEKNITTIGEAVEQILKAL